MIIRGRIHLTLDGHDGRIEVTISDNNDTGCKHESGIVFDAIRDSLVRKYENLPVSIRTERS